MPMRRILISAIILTLSASAVCAQKRNKRRAPAKETVDYPAEISKCLNAYNLDEAENLLDKWESELDRARKDYPESLSKMRGQAMNMRNLMERVEKIELIDTLHVDTADFYRHYMLSSDAGELLDGMELPDEYAISHPTMVFRPQNGKELFWSMPDKKGHKKIVRTQVLDDGTVTPPESLADEIDKEGNPDYPFVMDDGMTIYFAANGKNSLGGYDIFMTRRDSDGEVLQAQNLGMPFNSPFNEYMMVVDDVRNLGWWASDREQIPGKLTIYVFRPSSMRVNYDADEPNLASYALLKGVTPQGDLDTELSSPAEQGAPVPPEFIMPMGNGKVYTRIDQFGNPSAAHAMGELIQMQDEAAEMQALLTKLRVRYAKGDKKLAKEISNLERRVAETQGTISRLSNKVVNLETSKSRR